MKITALLFLAELESALPFWVDRMGFDKVAEMPHEDKIGFVILTKSGTELMLQSHASAAADSPALAEFAQNSRTALYIEVDDFNDTLARLKGYPISMPVRETFYGMREIGVTAPGDHMVVFAAKLG